MKAKEIVEHCPDNRVILRDYTTGLVIKKEIADRYMNHDVVKIYGRSHKCGAKFQVETDIVVMIRAELDKE